MLKSDITYAGIIPLIGGMLFGAEKVLNKKPNYILSYVPFNANDYLYLKYNQDVRYYTIEDNNERWKSVNIVLSLCPCAGLSQLNSAKSRGSEAPQNDWMYKSTEYTLDKIQPNALIGENAPALYDGKHGEPVLQRLKEIGKKYGYCMSMIKTSSHLHGIPQRRKRSFYIFWKGEKCPILHFSEDSSIVNLSNYLSNITISPEEKEEVTNTIQKNNFEYKFIRYKFGSSWRSNIKENGYSLLDYIIHNSSLAEYISYLKQIECPEKYINKIEYIKGKTDAGLNFRDWSYYIATEYTNALTGSGRYILHPTEDRALTVKELMYLMALPSDMEHPKVNDLPKLFQNVPATTAAYWINEIVEVLLGNRQYGSGSFVKQNNIKKITDVYN